MLTNVVILILVGELWCYMHEVTDVNTLAIVCGATALSIFDVIIKAIVERI